VPNGIRKARSARRASRPAPSADADAANGDDDGDGDDAADPLRAAFDVLFGRPGPDLTAA